METKTKYMIAVAAIGVLLIAYGFLSSPAELLPVALVHPISTANVTAPAQNIAATQTQTIPLKWRFPLGILVGGALVYMFKRGADYYVGASYEVVEQKIRDFAREHKNMKNLIVENLNEVSRGVWEGSIRNMTPYKDCEYRIDAPFIVRVVGGKIKQFDCKAVIDPRVKQYVHFDAGKIPDAPKPEPPKVENVNFKK